MFQTTNQITYQTYSKHDDFPKQSVGLDQRVAWIQPKHQTSRASPSPLENITFRVYVIHIIGFCLIR